VRIREAFGQQPSTSNLRPTKRSHDVWQDALHRCQSFPRPRSTFLTSVIMATLLSFHKSILQRIHDPSTSDLLILARGLGLRRIICTLMKIYDSPQNLVLLVNASQEEESAIGEELGLMGCRKPGLRIVGYEINNKDRWVYPYIRSKTKSERAKQKRLIQWRRLDFGHVQNPCC
jgi:hypothetical protein